MKEITKIIPPEEFSLWLRVTIACYDIPKSELIKAAGIKDESFLEPYLTESSMQITDTQNKLYHACAKIIAATLNTKISDAGINYEYIAQTLSVSRTTIDNWLNQYEEALNPFEQFDQIQDVIESSRYYLGFKRLPDKEFAKFFDKNDNNTLGKLWKKNGLSIEKINRDLGLTKNKSSFIRNNQQSLSTKKQYEILSKAYDMCVDYTCQYYEGFEDIGRKLYHLLNLQYHEDIASNFSDIYRRLQVLLKFNTDELYFLLLEYYSEEEFTISRRSFELLCTKNTFYWDIKEKARILEYIMFVSSWYKNESSVLAFGTIYLTRLCVNLKNIKEGVEETLWEERLKDLSSDLKKYPLKIQRIIVSHADVFLDIDLDRYFKKSNSASYKFRSFSGPGKNKSRGKNPNIHYYIDRFINLPDSAKREIIEKYSKEFPVYLNFCSNEFRYITQCCDMIIQSEKIPALKMEPSGAKPADYLTMEKTDRKFWRNYDKYKIRQRLRYTPLDWNFLAIIMLIMDRENDLSILENDLQSYQISEPDRNTKDNDKSYRRKRFDKEHSD